MFDSIKDVLTRIFNRLKTGGKNLKTGIAAGVVVGAIGVLAGGILMQGILASLVINALSWKMILDSERATNFMRKYGIAVDILITVGGFFLPVPGVTGFFVGVLIGAGFTIFRLIFLGDKVEADCIDAEFVTA